MNIFDIITLKNRASLGDKAKKIDTIINVLDVPNITFEGSLLQNLSADGTDQYNKYDRLARYLKSIGGGILQFPKNEYSFSKFPLYNKVSIIGGGMGKTTFKALASSETGFIYLNDLIYQVAYKDFTVQGISTDSINITQHGIYVQAIDTSYNTGGLWYSNFKRVRVQGFGGSQWYFEAVDVNGHDLANQFLYFEQCEGYKLNNLTSRCLVVKTQAGQFNFNSCCFDNSVSSGVGTNIELASTMCNFTLLTCQSAEYGMVITGGNTSLIQPWFENLKYSITQVVGTDGTCHVAVRGGNFANACYDGSGTGYGIYIGDSCTCNIDSIMAKGNIESIYKMDNNCGFVNIGTIYTGVTTGIPASTKHTKQISGVTNTYVGYSNSYIVNIGGNIKNFYSKLPVNSLVTLIAFQGNLTIQTGGNIAINSNIKLFTKGTITIRKIDLWNNWAVESIYQPTQWSSASPTTGTWEIADKSYNNAPVGGGYEGWLCTVAGTMGTLNSGNTTGSITSGTTSLAVNSATGLSIGDYITIAGVTGIKKVTNIGGTTITIDTNADVTVTNGAVAFSPATFKGFGAIQA